ncbi:ribosylnicotinamide kinase Ecym_8192 [Eremothecium cymbalariae DBVPG|uniref:Phosphoribulokinase/uridine kinase domain-containing protein n=1 Tax=Eremothecium cymbalariae (strain CBS 270.75 / DBVPG 7215 / KCTC 17166 / NRRL Y-17582) TaxID=931890 RepID=G8JXA3_ERECY|nr:Hypothetical protein Ecym_8192 [Eremothecium cymbalariae DBVPG\
MTSKPALLVGISGCSSSGKTTLSKLASYAVPGSILIHQDDFYKHDNEIPINEEYMLQNWDCADALHFEAFTRELQNIKSLGRMSVKPVKNDNHDGVLKFNIDDGFWESINSQYGTRIKALSYMVVFVEGFMLYHDECLASLFDIKLLLRAPYATLKARRAARPGYRTLDSYWIDPPYYFDEFVYKSYAESHRSLFADGDVEGKLLSSDITEILNDETTDIRNVLVSVLESVLNVESELTSNTLTG